MPMIHCRDCGAEVSKLADVCPKCGRPVNASLPITERKFSCISFGCVILVIAAAAVFLSIILHH